MVYEVNIRESIHNTILSDNFKNLGKMGGSEQGCFIFIQKCHVLHSMTNEAPNMFVHSQ